MALREREITGILVDGDGTPITSAKVSFQPTKPIGYTSTHVVVDRLFTVTTDPVTGEFSATLWCDEDSLVSIDYTVKFPTANSSDPDSNHQVAISVAYEDGTPKDIGTLIAESTTASDIVSEQPLSDLIDQRISLNNSSGGVGSIFIDASKLQHIDAGAFFLDNYLYSHAFWEATVKVSHLLNAPGYIVSPNHGGDHQGLWGVEGDGTNFTVTGNVTDGSHPLQDISSPEVLPVEVPMTLAWGWDGTFIYTWVEGVLSNKQDWVPAGGGMLITGGGNADLQIGGSDHNNFWGNIWQIRAYLGYGACLYDSEYSPEYIFRPQSRTLQGFNVMPQFFHNYMIQQMIYPDLSAGFEGMLHPGVPNAQLSVQDTGKQLAPLNDLDLPTFVPGMPDRTYVPTASATPSGAIVWDSFSRANSSMVQVYGAIPRIGSTEAGSAGIKVWKNLDGTTASGFGIIFGQAFNVFNSTNHVVVDAGVQNADVRVNRMLGKYQETGLTVRYKDANDYYEIIGTDTNVVVTKHEGGVVTSVGYPVTSNWKTLRVVASGTSFSIYTGTDTEGLFTLAGTFTGTNVAGATNFGLARTGGGSKNPNRYDNFLILAG